MGESSETKRQIRLAERRKDRVRTRIAICVECPSEIPCLVTGLPDPVATSDKNSAYNGEALIRQIDEWVIPWEVVRRRWIDPVTTHAPLVSGAWIAWVV